jgi:hypothetical protein
MYFTISTLFIDVLPCPVAVSTAARTRSLGIWFTSGSLGAIGAYQLQASIDGPTSYLAIAAPVVALRVAPRNRNHGAQSCGRDEDAMRKAQGQAIRSKSPQGAGVAPP